MRVNFGSGVHLPFIHIRRITFNIINFVILLEIGFLNMEDFLGFFFPLFVWNTKVDLTDKPHFAKPLAPPSQAPWHNVNIRKAILELVLKMGTEFDKRVM